LYCQEKFIYFSVIFCEFIFFGAKINFHNAAKILLVTKKYLLLLIGRDIEVTGGGGNIELQS
jgi:hypothetical protein